MSRHNRGRRKVPKYIPAAIRALEGVVVPGQVYVVNVMHDSWCDRLAGRGECNCNPNVMKPQRIPRPEEN